MAFIPLLLAGIPALLQSAGAIQDMVLRGQGKGFMMPPPIGPKIAALIAMHRRRHGGAASHMGSFPLLQRPMLYAQGGKMIRNLVPYMTHGGRYARRAPRRRGKGPIADVLSKIPLLGMLAGPIARAFGAGRMPHRRGGTYVRPHLSHTKYGQPVHVRGYHKPPTGMGLLAPAGRGVYVRPHMSHTKYGQPVHVRGYHTGAGMMHMVRPHRVRAHMSHNRYGQPIMVRGYRTGKGLLAPAGGYLPYSTMDRGLTRGNFPPRMLSVY